MNLKLETRYKLAPGSQVREETFGLLFYAMAGPRLYFLSCGRLLDRGFFNGELTLKTWMSKHTDGNAVPTNLIQSLKKSLDHLQEKGVIIEC